jgi:hypothetical protein
METIAIRRGLNMIYSSPGDLTRSAKIAFFGFARNRPDAL